MPKTQIVDLLGQSALALPGLLSAGLAANERAKYILTLLQTAASQAENPQTPAPSLRREREDCGIAAPGFDRIIGRSEYDGGDVYHIPDVHRLIAMLDDALRAMIAPLRAAGANGTGEENNLYVSYTARLEKLIAARPPLSEDMISRDTIAALTSGRPRAGDGFHLLIMDLHKEVNRLQAAISTADVSGAKAYGLADADIPILNAFMAGVNRTAPLKFDHPGLQTIAVGAKGGLTIQNDIGTTEAHVLIVTITDMRVVVRYTDVHLPRLRFLQERCNTVEMKWEEVHARQSASIAKEDLFYLAIGEYAAPDQQTLTTFLEKLGSSIVFLIDWNKARKRLGVFVPNDTAIDILRWAADQEIGHRGFLQLGGERLIYDALEQAVKTPLRYGEPLHDMIGVEAARDYLRFVLEVTATGLLKGRSETLIRDRVRAELHAHLRSAEQRFLAECAKHAGIILQLAEGLRAGLRSDESARGNALAQHALRAKQWETKADDLVKDLRLTVRRVPGTEVFSRIVETADDAADHLEDAAFFAGLLFEAVPPSALPQSLLALADSVVEGTQAFGRAMAFAQNVHHGGDREATQLFLESADIVVTVEHQTDELERAATIDLMKTALDCRQLHLLSNIGHHLEASADALMRASLKLRDHILGEVVRD